MSATRRQGPRVMKEGLCSECSQSTLVVIYYRYQDYCRFKLSLKNSEYLALSAQNAPVSRCTKRGVQGFSVAISLPRGTPHGWAF
jgi:hypothetical protein